MKRTEKLLTTGRVADLCGFSPSSILHWIRTGKLQAYTTPGGQYRVHPEQLLRFLLEHGMHVPSELRPAGRHRVLIVDDEEIVRDVLVRMLRASGLECAVETAENGVVGCMKLPVFKPDLVVLDVVMPDVNGAELCRTLKATDTLPATKVLVVTGYPHDARLEEAIEAGADGWLAKPVEFRPFVAKVAEMLGADGPTRPAYGAQGEAAAASASSHAPGAASSA
ncbi:MAG: response regulator [Candidatus Brocadiia bacterium]